MDAELSRYLPWRIAGRYFESCNCDAICPCRTVGGRPGGRSTHGVCFGALSWLIDDGRAGDVELDGLAAALVFRYDDEEPGSPWRFVVHVDARGDEPQHAALSKILLGELGGDHVLGLPWVRKASDLLEVTASAIDLAHGPGGYELRVGDAVGLAATRAVWTEESVTCIVPGHHRPGTELEANCFVVDDGPFRWELAGNCAFAGDFAYTSG